MAISNKLNYSTNTCRSIFNPEIPDITIYFHHILSPRNKALHRWHHRLWPLQYAHYTLPKQQFHPRQFQVKSCNIILYIIFFLFKGQETKPSTDDTTDSGRSSMLTTRSLNSSSIHGSSNSLNSSSSTLYTNSSSAQPLDNPEQFEELKQQKELWETGIEM